MVLIFYIYTNTFVVEISILICGDCPKKACSAYPYIIDESSDLDEGSSSWILVIFPLEILDVFEDLHYNYYKDYVKCRILMSIISSLHL